MNQARVCGAPSEGRGAGFIKWLHLLGLACHVGGNALTKRVRTGTGKSTSLSPFLLNPEPKTRKPKQARASP
jgi:hypothetical protein